MHQITKISSVANPGNIESLFCSNNKNIASLFCSNNENIESLFCPDRIMTSCSMQPLTTRRTSNTSTALWRFGLSGLIQTSFDQVFITTCFMWLLTTTILRQTNDGHKSENRARHHNFRTKMKIMSCLGACSSCACTACRTRPSGSGWPALVET